MDRSFRALLGIALALLLTALSAVAGAVELRDVESDFRMRVDAPDLLVCPRLPPVPDASEACAGIPGVPDADDVAAAGITHYVTVHWDTWGAAISLYEHERSHALVSETELLGAETGVLTGIQRLSGKHLKFDRRDLGGVRALVSEDEMVVKGVRAFKITVLLFGDGRLVVPGFQGPVEHADEVRALAEAALATVSIRAPKVVLEKLDPPPKKLGAPPAKLPLAIGVALGLVVLVVVLAYSVKKREEVRGYRAAVASGVAALLVIAHASLFKEVALFSSTSYVSLPVLASFGIVVGAVGLFRMRGEPRREGWNAGVAGVVVNAILLGALVLGVMTRLRP